MILGEPLSLDPAAFRCGRFALSSVQRTAAVRNP
jgi:hypothetical protein